MLRASLFVLAFGSCLIACSPNNVKEDNSLKALFDSAGVAGTFGMFDNGQGSFSIYNLERFRDSVYTPASTFKIVNSLIGIETGRVKDDSTVFVWDGVHKGRDECNRDMSMYQAFRLSCPPWYQQLALRIGKDTMQHWLDTLGYAAKNGRFVVTPKNLDSFWLNNAMKITADEELGLVKKLYFDQLPFQKRSQEIVRRMMLWENNTAYSLSYKTGWGNLENGHDLGWIVGWIEENKHPYFFVLQLETPRYGFDMKSVRINLLKAILRRKGFM
ncbi:MAG: class D beta-lactamase, partial [Bacteroidetes bacterium]|nr:class D beta-lactamase [Bacteroidota bacterium]